MTDFGAVVAELRLFHHNAAADAVEALRSRIGALEAAISGALELADGHDWAEEDWLQIGRIRVVLTLAPSVVLDGMIREAKADAWDEGASDGQWNAEHEAMIARGNREAIVNPYRNGEKP